MRFYPIAATGLSLAVAALAVWQVVESSNDLDDVPRYSPPASPIDNVVEISIETGTSPQDIGQELEDTGVIASATQFNILVSLLGYGGILQAGEYEFQPASPVLSVVYRIRRGETSTRSVTVREGWRLEEVADAVAEQGISRDGFIAEARARNFAFSAARPDGYEFLQDAARNASLEGYLYPATYAIRKADTPRSVIEKMLQAFGNNLTPDIQPAADAAGLSLYEVVTLASIIEREAVVPEERPIIAQVFLSRLRQGIPLEADPTVQYAIAEDPDGVEEYGYWKQELTRADLEYDSPYNTYANDGLPPGPICNPRLDSISAVVHPADTNYLYFVAKGDGSHAFAATLAEHLENVEKYRPDQ
jgi:UPF0755 protein